MGSVFYGLTVINIRLYIALGSSVIGMMVYSVEKGKRSKSSIRSKCHRVIGVIVFSLFMMHVQGSVSNLRDCASMMLSEREGKECTTNKKGVSAGLFSIGALIGLKIKRKSLMVFNQGDLRRFKQFQMITL